jgi:hypothetical protein
MDQQVGDPLLKELCKGNHKKISVYKEINAPPPKDQYSAAKDFPCFGERLATLQAFVVRQNPSNLTKLWYDRRDTCKSPPLNEMHGFFN